MASGMVFRSIIISAVHLASVNQSLNYPFWGWYIWVINYLDCVFVPQNLLWLIIHRCRSFFFVALPPPLLLSIYEVQHKMQSPDAAALVPAQNSIADLVIGLRNQVIEALVYRKWIAKSLPDMAETGFVCMLIDSTGNAIHATMDHNNLTHFDTQLVGGKVYRISRFSVDKTSPYQQSITNPISLRFGMIAKFDVLEGKEEGWPQHYFEFVPFRALSSRVPYKDVNNKTVYPLLTDYIGHVRFVGDLPPARDGAQSNGLRLKIDIENLDGAIVELTLWDESAARFPKASIEASTKPAIIAVSSCRVSKYRGAIQLSGMPATHYYINQKIPEITTLFAAFQEKFKTNPPLLVSKKHLKAAEIEATGQIQTLEALLRHPPAAFKGVSFAIQATITDVVQNRSWYYVSCTQCKKQPLDYEGIYECEDHGELETPTFRYNFKATVHDGTASAKFTFFSPAGDEVTAHPCSELAAKYRLANRKTVPQEVAQIAGRKHMFAIQFVASSAFGSGEFNVLAVMDKPNALTPPLPAIKGTAGPSAITIHDGHLKTQPSTQTINAENANTGTPAQNFQAADLDAVVAPLQEGENTTPQQAVTKHTTSFVAALKGSEPQADKKSVRRSILPQLEQEAKKAKKN